MKKFKNILKLIIFVGAVSLVSCGDLTELDLTENPNALQEGNADYFLNNAQEDFVRIIESFGRTAGQVTRVEYMDGRDYSNAYGPTAFDGRWRDSYAGMMMDLKQMNAIAAEKGMTHHIAMGQVMQAYTLMTLVDFFGDVPYSEALQGDEGILFPVADEGASVYEGAIALLDAAIAAFGEDASAEPALDYYYNGDWGKWIKAANTIKMKAYMATRLVDASAVTKFNAIVSSGNYIASTDDDFQFRWGTNEIQPDTRHPRYAGSYQSTGAGRYMSNSLMDYMTGKDPGAYLNPINFDPRVLFYFYRQVSQTPGIGGEPADEEVLECGLFDPPAHYEGFTFCGVPKGWWGRDHGNDNGIPPDGFLRTLTGVYPAGGVLDDWSYDPQTNGAGGGGNGITPIMLASWTKFMEAELEMVNGSTADAKTLMFEGIDMSWDKVLNFAPLTDRFNLIFDGVNNYDTIEDFYGFFTDDVSADWDATTDDEGKWNIFAMQYSVACYGNSIDTYNFYRRTGYPTTLQPNIEPNPGSFIRSFYYPANYVNTNPNASQKSGVDVQVYWDTNPASPGFPASN